MKKILFPTDFSDAARNAFSAALKIGKQMEAEVDVVSVFHLPFTDASSVPPEMIQKMLEESRQTCERNLASFVEGADPEVLGKSEALYGVFISTEVTDYAKYNHYDLIVMGTKGERNALEKLMGSVTTQTMMHAPCPVLAIPKEAKPEQFKRIAYATAFEKADNHAVDELLAFSRTIGASLHFIHVETDPDIGGEGEMIEMKDYPVYFSDFTIVNSRNVQEGLDRFIQEKEMDILALFIPKRRLWERLFHQSVTKRMTFHTKVPLLIFHA
jgi:nucleotide-binding universal stress UspA family protein